MKVTVVDMGNYNYKYDGAKGVGIFSSKYTREPQSYPEGMERIEVDGETTFIGIGKLEREFNKSNKNFLPQLLYAICKANDDQAIISTNLTILLPAIQMSLKENVVKKIKDKSFKVFYNGTPKNISIKEVLVLPEGYAGYFNLNAKDRQEDLLLLDMGSRTINMNVIVEGKINKMETLPIGSLDLATNIMKNENAKGKKYTEEDIERLVNKGKIKVDDITYEMFLENILDSIKNHVDINDYKVVCFGGLSIWLKEEIENKIKDVTILDNALTANVEGAKIASKAIWHI